MCSASAIQRPPDWDAIESEIDAAAGTLPAVVRTADPVGRNCLRQDYPVFDRQDDNVRFLSDVSRRHLDPLGGGVWPSSDPAGAGLYQRSRYGGP